MIRRSWRLGLAALGVTALTLTPPAAGAAQEGPGGIGIRLVDTGVGPDGDPRARIYIVDHLAPGAVIERRVEVSNTTASSHQIALYTAGAGIEDGVFLGAEGTTANELSKWSTVTPGRLDIGPGEKRMALVRIAVPADASAGEQYAAVWAEMRSDSGEDRVVQVNRVGVRQYVSVGYGAAPGADFTVSGLTPTRSAGGDPMVSAVVRNTGGRALDITGSLTMSNGPGGLSAGPFPAELNKTLAIGDVETIAITLDQRLPSGPWDAAMALRSGGMERSGEGSLTFPGVMAVAIVPEPSPSWPLIGGTTTLALFLGFLCLNFIRSVRRAGRR